jgi:hypothetical protein
MAESLTRASGISLGASGAGLVQLHHREDLVVDKAAGRKNGDARRHNKLRRECRISG